jgi:hypothetical protein
MLPALKLRRPIPVMARAPMLRALRTRSGGVHRSKRLAVAAGALAMMVLAGGSPAGSVAHAQSSGASAKTASSCAALGEGFVRMPGSDTCVRLRGAARAEAFSGGTVSSNPGYGNTATTLGGDGTAQGTAPDPWKQAR